MSPLTPLLSPCARCAVGSYPKGSLITGLKEASAVCGVNVYHAGTALNQVSEEMVLLSGTTCLNRHWADCDRFPSIPSLPSRGLLIQSRTALLLISLLIITSVQSMRFYSSPSEEYYITLLPASRRDCLLRRLGYMIFSTSVIYISVAIITRERLSS